MSTASADDGIRLSLDQVRALARRTLAAHGFSTGHVDAIGDVVAAAEADGCTSHGLMRLAGYVGSVRSGRIDPCATPRFEDTAPAAVLIDGGGGYSPLALRLATPHLVERARSLGVATLHVRNAHHLHALWHDIELLAAQGLMALAFVAARPVVSIFGSRHRQLGTNPLAFACPRKDAPPFVCDFATSAAARGEIMLAQREGRPIPGHWAQDVAGRPTTDPASALAGTMLPFGNGPKGSALGLMVELFAVVASGGRFGFEALGDDVQADGGPLATGQTLIALDPHAVTGDVPGERMDALVRHLRRSEDLRLPGDRRLANRTRSTVEGIRVHAAVLREIEALSRTGTSPPG